MKRSVLAALAVIVMAAGTWQVGEGVWIYAKAQLAQYLLQRAWQRALEGEVHPKPWPWADTWPLGRLLVPKHGIDLIVLAGASGRTLAFGPGHVSSSAPLGQPGIAVLTGHRDTHFRLLQRLELGDEILIQVPREGWYRYRVTEREVVDGRHLYITGSAKGALALITCYPFDAVLPGGPYRFVVTAERLSFPEPTPLR